MIGEKSSAAHVGTGPISRRAVAAAILVAALGYFVDVYDLILFSIVRIKSLIGIGVAKEALLSQGVHLLNMQMIGMLIGGILWGILGDKRGRLSVLFGSIIMYTAANIANGFVTTVEMYSVLRFIAGVGLAGELGAGVTLVTEIMPKETRGYGTMIVATIGIFGAIVAALVGDLFDWRTAYFIGGGLGILLLLMRIGVVESGLFKAALTKKVSRGNFLSLFSTFPKAIKYLSCILIGVPIWYVMGILITFSPEIGTALGMTVIPEPGKAVLFSYIGLVLGDFTTGTLSQLFKTRRRVVFGFLILTAALITYYLVSHAPSISHFYVLCMALGFGIGYWAVFVTIASEQFGTNIRATVATTAPNFVRGATVPLTLAFQALKPRLGILGSAGAVGAACIMLSLLSLAFLEETHGKSLDFWEA